jgi:UDP-N-acetylmuramoyl-L-alanyl-D-glutamate--2,6-diaminopimelate ligase
MRLSALTGCAPHGGDPDITGLTADSRAVKPGYLFAALPGARADGSAFVEDAVRKGAVAILAGASGVDCLPPGIALVRDANPRRRLALMAARFHPGQPATMVAVTGTNGKTSVASFTRQIWAALGYSAASFGTVGIVSPRGSRGLGHTTPDPVEIHRLLDELSAEGVTHAAFEASSHGLAQFRADAVRLKAAGFTNLTRDHLDYHLTFDAYRDAKMRLFREVLGSDGVAVINADGAGAAPFLACSRQRGLRLISVGAAGRDLQMTDRVPVGDGQQVVVTWQGRSFQFMLPLAGAFQASNALVAAGLVLGTGGEPEGVFAALGALVGAAGRLEKIGVSRAGVPVYVDYAHTPDALETVLQALRPHTQGQLWVVFGCGGDRDAGKRPLMGMAARAHADRIIVTDDNPRTEDPAAIRAAVLAGATGAVEIGDRAAAIAEAITAARTGDVVVIAGKGHEAGQIIGHEVLPFNDADEVRSVISRTRIA